MEKFTKFRGDLPESFLFFYVTLGVFWICYIYNISSIEGGKNATTLKTGGGITAGSSREDIVTAYKEQLGEDTDTTKDKIVLDNMGYSRLIFTLKKDKVVSVCMELVK